jgi:hypothetical protein
MAARIPEPTLRACCLPHRSDGESGRTQISRLSASPSVRRPPAGNGTGGKQDEQSIWIAHRRESYWSAWRRLSDAPGGTAEAETGKPAKRSPGIDEERQNEESSPQRRDRRPVRHVALERVEFQDAGAVVGNACVTEEDNSQASTGRAEKTWPVALDQAVLQQVQAQPVPVEPQAGLKVADDHDGMMNASGHKTARWQARPGQTMTPPARTSPQLSSPLSPGPHPRAALGSARVCRRLGFTTVRDPVTGSTRVIASGVEGGRAYRSCSTANEDGDALPDLTHRMAG